MGYERTASLSVGGPIETIGTVMPTRRWCRRADGTAFCWGQDDSGQASPPDGERFSAISCGAWHTCGIREDGRAVCWGLDSYGQASPPQ